MCAVRTVGELRAIIADLPDDMPFEVFSERMDSFVCFDVAVHDEFEEEIGRDALVVWAEN